MTITQDRILRRSEVERILSMSRASFWRIRQKGDFPRPIQLAKGIFGWRLSAVQAWISSREMVA